MGELGDGFVACEGGPATIPAGAEEQGPRNMGVRLGTAAMIVLLLAIA